MDGVDNADFRAWMQRRDEAIMHNLQNAISEKITHQTSEIERQARERYEELLTSASNHQVAKDAALREALSRITELEERIRAESEDTRGQGTQEAHGPLDRDSRNLPIVVAGDMEDDQAIVDGEQIIEAPALEQRATTSEFQSGSTSTSNSKTRRKQPKPSTHIHRLMKEELGASQQIVKTAFTTHLRILWGAQDANAVLPSPPDAQIQAFQSRFTSSKEVAAALRSPRLLTDKSLVLISRDYRSQNVGGKRNAIEFLEEDVLDYMQTYCAKYGLYPWCPNLSESPYSVHNSACRLVAIATFKHALSTDPYAFTGVDTGAATDMDILIRIYDHFVHHLPTEQRYEEPRECTALGTPQHHLWEALQQHDSSFCGKMAVSVGISHWYAIPKRIVMMTWIQRTDNVLLKRRVERSAQAETFFRRLDQMRRTAILQEGGQWRQRPRKVVPDQPLSEFPQLPKAMPIDYYSPSFYNGLSGRQKQKFANASTVALPPDATHILITGSKHSTERLSDKAFFDTYAEDILDAYALNSDSDDGQEGSLSREGSDMESDHSMDVSSGDEMESAAITRDQIAHFVGLVEMAGV